MKSPIISHMLSNNSASFRLVLAFGCFSVAVLLICFGLAAKREIRATSSLQRDADFTGRILGFLLLPCCSLSSFEGCFKEDVDDYLVDGNTKVVLMVIDAWRLSFLVDSDSPMMFLRSSITSGRGVGFVARVQTPTVTMPRIMALTSGTIPSFMSLVTNFFATVSTEESWVTSAAAVGKRLEVFD
ncbi:unnamed protein product [Cylicostephanus goldi]|uniref:Uncharacterized protein n=1 Tax=Cylicostephanus goldi TaxID=71465 RepID=A0A3P6RLM2_CYLGO|nr:unnamed protein product [Cylicostephanus goldi]